MQDRARRLKRITRVKRVALALAVAAIAAPTAQAYYPDEGTLANDDSAGVVIRGEYKGDIGGAVSAPVRGENKTDVRDVTIVPVSTSAPETVGFDWRDAGIGAAGAFALALLGASALLGLRRRGKSGLATA